MNKNVSFLVGFTFGAACMYAFDPGMGRRRRASMRDQLTRVAHKSGDGLDAVARDWSNRAAGTMAKARRRFRADRPADDMLVERVRAELGHAVSHPRAIDIEAYDGTVRLCGPILRHEVPSLLRAVESVSGVRRVENWLEPHDEPGNFPSLQGGSDKTMAQW
jgi:osmotically-inducible protein OsmY